MFNQFLIGLAVAAAVSTTHTTGNLATKGTCGAWATEKVELAADAKNVVTVSASANGSNTYLDCDFIVYGQVVLSQKHTLMCGAKVNNLVFPYKLTIKLTNENKEPAIYDIAVQSSK